MGLLQPLTIGSVKAPNNLVLSPMAGFTDLPFRLLCAEHGAGVVSTEQVSAASILHDGEGTLQRATTWPDEGVVIGGSRWPDQRAAVVPVMLQIFGHDPTEAADAARAVAPRATLLGFNFGCPAHQIKRAGCGAALLDDPARARALLQAVKEAAPERPLVAKMRLGDKRRVDYVGFARECEEAGADAVIVHGRAACDGYSGVADWRAVGEVVDALSVPVIVNGDVRDGPSAAAALRESGAHGVAIGRASLGDPRIFRRIAAYAATGVEPVTSPEDRAVDFLRYVEVASMLRLPEGHVRCQALKFTRGMEGGRRLRHELSSLPLTEVVARLAAQLERAATSSASAPRRSPGVTP